MTTIACNREEIAADTRCTWEGVGTDVYSTIKVYAGQKSIYGITGENCDGSLKGVAWLQSGKNKDDPPQPPEYENAWDWKIIELSPEGIGIFNIYLERDKTLEPFLAVGSGRKVAMYCMKYLGMSPAEAVNEACKVDHWSEVPIYRASLKTMKVERWHPKPAKKLPRIKT